MAEIKKLIKKNKLTVILAILLVISFLASTITVLEEKRVTQLWEIRRDKEAMLEKLVELSIQYPDYRDLLYRLAISQSELGNDDAAKEALNRARYLDPNNETLIKIAGSLNISLSD
jgi:tetratricopeptide (TPR) repeat protein